MPLNASEFFLSDIQTSRGSSCVKFCFVDFNICLIHEGFAVQNMLARRFIHAVMKRFLNENKRLSLTDRVSPEKAVIF